MRINTTSRDNFLGVAPIEPIWHLLGFELGYLKPANPRIMNYSSDLIDAE
jgi:hypothetical protein